MLLDGLAVQASRHLDRYWAGRLWLMVIPRKRPWRTRRTRCSSGSTPQPSSVTRCPSQRGAGSCTHDEGRRTMQWRRREKTARLIAMRHRSFTLECTPDMFHARASETDSLRTIPAHERDVAPCRRLWSDVGAGFWTERCRWDHARWRKHLRQPNVVANRRLPLKVEIRDPSP